MLPRSRTLPHIALRGAVAAVAALAVTFAVPHLVDAEQAGAPAPQADQLQLAAGGNPVTPGNIKGFGFDQCLAPSQDAMNRWMQHSPFLAAGIYIHGSSRACRHQPNLTPTWIRNQLRNGWKLLPITLGPQASCNPRFPRYRDDRKINPTPGSTGKYAAARRQGRAEAEGTVTKAKSLGIVPGSTLWYDMEAFDLNNTHCRESALAFMSAWTTKLRALNYVSGVYSSAGSGIKALDDVRVERPRAYVLPDQIWIARWDGVANTSTSYIREDGWRPGRRLKQYQGGHQETWGSVTINIDRNFLALGKGMHAASESHCGGVSINYRSYPTLKPPTASYAPPHNQVRALQCLLKEKGHYGGKLNGKFWKSTRDAAKAWQRANGFRASGTWWRNRWTAILSEGGRPAQKYGSAGGATRRVQRALNAADPGLKRGVTGEYNWSVTGAVKAYQSRVGLKRTGIVNRATWKKLQAGVRN